METDADSYTTTSRLQHGQIQSPVKIHPRNQVDGLTFHHIGQYETLLIRSQNILLPLLAFRYDWGLGA